MQEVFDQCTLCSSKGTLTKEMFSSVNIVKKSFEKNKKPGSLVKQYIEDVREEVKEEKRRLKSQEYKK
mgnify:CR=1 FL=1